MAATILVILIVLILLMGFITVDGYNQLVTFQNRYQSAYAQIDVQLRRRHDLIPNLLETVKGYLVYERETLEAVVAARNTAVMMGRRASQVPGDPRAMQQLEEAEGVLTSALGQLLLVAEAYPELNADQSMGKLMEELGSTENRITFACQAFNDAVTLYNTKREVFPSNVIARLFNFPGAHLLEKSAPVVQEVPQVSF